MTSAQIQNLIVQNSKDLPKEVLQEILDFIQFLRIKKSSSQKAVSSLSRSEEKHLEDEFLDYKTQFPKE